MNVRCKIEILENYPKIKERVLDMVYATLGIENPTDGYLAMLFWVELWDNYVNISEVLAGMMDGSTPFSGTIQFWAVLEACELDSAKDMQPSLFS
jgi:hypothetical protein